MTTTPTPGPETMAPPRPPAPEPAAADGATEDGAGALGPEWAQRHLGLLAELGDMGMRLARTLTRQVLAQAEAAEAAEAVEAPAAARLGAVAVDPGLTFSRISRAVRLTLALEARLHRQIAADAERAANGGSAKKGAANDDDDDDDDEGSAPMAGLDYDAIRRRNAPLYRDTDYEIRRAVEETIEASSGDPDEVERLKDELVERLAEDDAFRLRAQWPVGEAIALICQDLGLEPDWDRWETKRWARREAAESPLCSPYATVAKPLQPRNQHPRTGTDIYREAKGLPPLEQPPPLRARPMPRGPP